MPSILISVGWVGRQAPVLGFDAVGLARGLVCGLWQFWCFVLWGFYDHKMAHRRFQSVPGPVVLEYSPSNIYPLNIDVKH